MLEACDFKVCKTFDSLDVCEFANMYFRHVLGLEEKMFNEAGTDLYRSAVHLFISLL